MASRSQPTSRLGRGRCLFLLLVVVAASSLLYTNISNFQGFSGGGRGAVGSETATWAIVKNKQEGKSEASSEPSTTQASEICSRFVPSTSTKGITTPPTASSLWRELKHQILNASYFPLEMAPNVAFRGWIDSLFHFYTAERLRRSISNPASTSAVRHILKILSDYPTTKEPLRVLVMGGSVTSGNGCSANPLGLKSGFLECAWSSRLEHLLNHVFFGGERVFQFFNAAVGKNLPQTDFTIEDRLLISLADLS
jgi:hypothetical protein